MNRKSTVWRLKFLRDICSSSEVFPSSYWVSDVTKGKRIAGGGEASVYIGRHRDHAVAVRQFHTEEALSDVPKVCRCWFRAPGIILDNQATVLGHNS